MILKIRFKDWRPGDIAKIITGVVGAGNGGGPYADRDTYRLDDGNNWHLRIEGDRARLSYRYPSAISPEVWAAIATILRERVGLEVEVGE